MPIGLVAGFVLGMALMIAPLALPGTGFISGTVISVFGLAITFITGTILVFTSLFKKAPAHEAFVITGGFGSKAAKVDDTGKMVSPAKARVIINGGSIVLPFLHEVTRVSLATMRIDVDRKGRSALLTADKLRADLEAQFYIKVEPDADSVLTAATTLAEAGVHREAVKQLVGDKLVAALRDVAATKTLVDLNQDRAGFAQAVQAAVQPELEANGLHLESVAISSLDQTPLDAWDEGNIFDSEGRRTVAEITSRNKVAANKAETEAAKEVERQNVERDQELARLRIEREQAHANADAQSARAREQSARDAGVAAVAREEAIQVRNVEREQAGKVALERAAQEREVAEQVRLIAVEDARRQHAEAETKRKAAEAELEQAKQRVITVELTEAAEREKRVAVIAKQSEADQAAIEERIGADNEAYKVTVAAQARQDAAVREAEAVRTTALAAKEASVLKAEGRRADEMVPVEVEARRVEVEAQRVVVLEKELKAKADHQEISAGLEIELRKLGVEEATAIAAAQAMGQALAAADITIWTDAEHMSEVTNAFKGAQAKGMMIEGFLDTLPAEAKQTASALVALLAGKLGNQSGTSSKGNSGKAPASA